MHYVHRVTRIKLAKCCAENEPLQTDNGGLQPCVSTYTNEFPKGFEGTSCHSAPYKPVLHHG